jgi:uncharacterized membrane protein
LKALRSYNKQLEKKVEGMTQELHDLRRRHLSLLRYKRQYSAAAAALLEQQQVAGTAVATAEAAAAKAASAVDWANRLETQVSDWMLGHPQRRLRCDLQVLVDGDHHTEQPAPCVQCMWFPLHASKL